MLKLHIGAQKKILIKTLYLMENSEIFEDCSSSGFKDKMELKAS